MGPYDFIKVLLMLLGFGSVLFLAFITTRYIGARTSKAMMGRHVAIVETISLGMDKRLHLVKAGVQYFLIASTSKTVEFISEVNLGEAEEDSHSESAAKVLNVFDFKSLFEKYAGMYASRKEKPGRQAETAIGEDRYDGEKFKSNLDRLKGITGSYSKQDSKNGDEFTNEK